MHIGELDGTNDATCSFFTFTYRTSIKHMQVYELANLLSNVMMDEILIKLTFVVLYIWTVFCAFTPFVFAAITN